jgi:hypothetical protein
MIGVIRILTDSGFLHFLQSPPPPIRLFFGLRWVTATLDIHGTGSRKVSTLNQSHVQRLIAGEVKWFGHSCIRPGRRYAGTIRMWHTPASSFTGCHKRIIRCELRSFNFTEFDRVSPIAVTTYKRELRVKRGELPFANCDSGNDLAMTMHVQRHP